MLPIFIKDKSLYLYQEFYNWALNSCNKNNKNAMFAFFTLCEKNTHLIPKCSYPSIVVVKVSNRYNPKTDIVHTQYILHIQFYCLSFY